MDDRRLGIMGGSFDPIHIAHLIIAEMVREALSLGKIVFVPVGVQPLKQGQTVASAEHRLTMVELAICDNPNFVLSRADVDRAGPSYTVDMLRLVREEWAEQGEPEMWLIMGADSLASLPQWRDPEGILAQARLAVVRRPGSEVDMEAVRAHLPFIDEAIDWVDAPLMDVSSTDIRRRVSEGRSIRYRMPEAVREYIKDRGLYKSDGWHGK
jgi:nicotinate-nucleotide adenylyltransferase